MQINSYTPGGHSGPVIGSDADGGFVVSWTDSQSVEYPDPYGPPEYVGRGGIYAQRFNALGNPIGPDFPIETFQSPGPRRAEPRLPPPGLFAASSDIAVDSEGAFIVSWSSPYSDGDDTSYTSIQARSCSGPTTNRGVRGCRSTLGRRGSRIGPSSQVGPTTSLWLSGTMPGSPYAGVVDQQDGSRGGTFAQMFASAPIFLDGFESGDFSDWSGSSP